MAFGKSKPNCSAFIHLVDVCESKNKTDFGNDNSFSNR